MIHPKTVQPMKSRNIILHVRSFLNNESKATKIGNFKKLKPVVPCLIKNSNQVMLSIRTKDLSFMSEGQLSEIYNIFSVSTKALQSASNLTLIAEGIS